MYGNLALILEFEFYLKGVKYIVKVGFFPPEKMNKYNFLSLLWYLKLSDLNVCRKIIMELIGLWTIVLNWLLSTTKITDPEKFLRIHMRTLSSIWYLLEVFWSSIGSTLTGVATGWTIPQITVALDAKAWCNKEHYFINLQYFMLLTCLE